MSTLCTICADEDSTEALATLPCGHSFHANCVVNWFRCGHDSCPNCRSEDISEEWTLQTAGQRITKMRTCGCLGTDVKRKIRSMDRARDSWTNYEAERKKKRKEHAAVYREDARLCRLMHENRSRYFRLRYEVSRVTHRSVPFAIPEPSRATNG